jgi:hypothetical protein
MVFQRLSGPGHQAHEQWHRGAGSICSAADRYLRDRQDSVLLQSLERMVNSGLVMESFNSIFGDSV